MHLGGEAGAERQDLQGSRCRLHRRSANRSLPERVSLQRSIRFMGSSAPRTGRFASSRQRVERFSEIDRSGDPLAGVTAAGRVALRPLGAKGRREVAGTAISAGLRQKRISACGRRIADLCR
jgi:hypothetical protein